MTRFSLFAFAFASLTFAGTANAELVLSISLTPSASDSITSQTYLCESGVPFAVQYVNARPNALAILSISGEERVFVNVVSASGAKYVSGPYVWWTKGDIATLAKESDGAGGEDCASQ